jgi:leader peptidase (prepilin peptidase)/N-methyltransferase
LFPEWSWILALFIGAAIGSFLNVVIYRMPRGISLSNPKFSFCPKCKHRLEIPDLFPLLSWLFLRGKCRHCKGKVPSRYFFVELINGGIWAGLWYQYMIAGWAPATAIAYALAASALVAIIFIDWELYIIPDQINAFLALTGMGYNVWLYATHNPAATTWGIPSSLAGWLVGVGVLWGIAFLGRVLFGKDAMGHGDIKMARGIGTVLFPAVAAMSFGIAVVLGAVLGVAQILIRREPPQLAGKVGLEGEAATEAAEEEQYLPPESVGSLCFCGLGYLLGIDIIGLFIPKLYIKWFKESPFEPVDEWEDYEVEQTMIPFGPYLALGAIVAAVFSAQLLHGVQAYVDWASGGHQGREHLTSKLGRTAGESWSVRE